MTHDGGCKIDIFLDIPGSGYILFGSASPERNKYFVVSSKLIGENVQILYPTAMSDVFEAFNGWDIVFDACAIYGHCKGSSERFLIPP